MLTETFNKLKFRIKHGHGWRCTKQVVSDMSISERQYWHVDKCTTRKCQKRIKVMNGLCEGENCNNWRKWL